MLSLINFSFRLKFQRYMNVNCAIANAIYDRPNSPNEKSICEHINICMYTCIWWFLCSKRSLQSLCCEISIAHCEFSFFYLFVGWMLVYNNVLFYGCVFLFLIRFNNFFFGCCCSSLLFQTLSKCCVREMSTRVLTRNWKVVFEIVNYLTWKRAQLWKCLGFYSSSRVLFFRSFKWE